MKQWLTLSTAGWLHRLGWLSAADCFGILMYHRVTTPVAGHPFPTWNVTPRRLRQQLSGLLKRGYTPWPLRRVLAAHAQGQSIPRRIFVVTFDDGYANNFTAALPILRELQVPATIFVATAYLDSDEPFPNDDWPSSGSTRVPRETWRPLKTSEVHALQECDLIEIGCHTHTHADFRGRPDALREDLAQSLSVLRSTLGVKRPTFAFPYGSRSAGFTSPDLVEVVRAAGLTCSLTTESVTVPISSSPYEWGRFTATQQDTACTLAAKLDGCYSFLRSLARWTRRHEGHRRPVCCSSDGSAVPSGSCLEPHG